MPGNTTPATPLQGWPIPINGDDPDVPGDMANLAKAIEKNVIGTYLTVADRDAKITSPSEGQFAYVKGNDTLYWYTGAPLAWAVFPPVQPAITSGTSVPPNSSGANGDVFFKV
jgi:hypothetical protein